MNQNIWGPHFWETLHCVSFNYPINPSYTDKLNYHNFFMSLKYVLPCKWCQKNYERNINEYPIKLESRKDLIYWLIDLHNEVNGKEGRRQYSYEEVIKRYEHKYNKKIDILFNTDQKSCIYYTHIYDKINIILTLIALICILILLRKK